MIFFGDECYPEDLSHEVPVKKAKKVKRHGKTIHDEKCLHELAMWLFAEQYPTLKGMITSVTLKLDEMTGRQFDPDKVIVTAALNAFRDTMISVAQENYNPKDVQAGIKKAFDTWRKKK